MKPKHNRIGIFYASFNVKHAMCRNTREGRGPHLNIKYATNAMTNVIVRIVFAEGTEKILNEQVVQDNTEPSCDQVGLLIR